MALDWKIFQFFKNFNFGQLTTIDSDMKLAFMFHK